MQPKMLLVGSLDALRAELSDNGRLHLSEGADVVVVPTAAAFSGLTEAAIVIADLVATFDHRVEGLMIADRAASNESYFAERLRSADLVVLCDGSALHARSVWRATPISEAFGDAKRLVAIGSVASVLGEVMIDPRGGAPTIGLDLFRGVVVTTPASEEQLTRTRTLVTSEVALVVLNSHGVVSFDGTTWRVINDDVVVTRGHDNAFL
jgi:cyanophycinase